jgi:hypothetical protein
MAFLLFERWINVRSNNVANAVVAGNLRSSSIETLSSVESVSQVE